MLTFSFFNILNVCPLVVEVLLWYMVILSPSLNLNSSTIDGDNEANVIVLSVALYVIVWLPEEVSIFPLNFALVESVFCI